MCNALRVFINQRSGIEFGNYQCGTWEQTRKCFNGDYRPMLRHGKQAREMLRAVELRESITAEMLKEASRAYSGRLQFIEKDGKVGVQYTTGQYFPTEYRKAACSVLAQCLWDYFRANLSKCEIQGECGTCADSIRKAAQREFGRSIASTWFN